MNILKEEREIFDGLFPGLYDKLLAVPFEEKELVGKAPFHIYTDAGGAGLLVPKEYGGLGVTPVEGVAVHRVLGMVAPSIAVAMTMHNFTAAFLSAYTMYGDLSKQFLRKVAEEKLLLASGFAEGKTGANVLNPTMTAKKVEGGYVVNGAKKPCSLSSSMDYLTAGVSVLTENSEAAGRGIAIIPSSLDGIEISAFWKANSLKGAESNAVTLTDVFIPDDHMFVSDENVDLDQVEGGGYLWFQLIVTASYIGLLTSLQYDVYKHERYTAEERVRVSIDVETAASALRGIAYEMQASETIDEEPLLARVLLVRYGVQKIIGDAKNLAAELLGGIHFIKSPDLEYKIAALSALALHPPSRLLVAPALDDYIGGGPLVMD